MKDQIKYYKNENKAIKNYIKDSLTLKKAPTLKYNNQIYNRSNTTKFDIEKAHFEADLLLDEEKDSLVRKNESIFEKKVLTFLNFIAIYLNQLIGFIVF